MLEDSATIQNDELCGLGQSGVFYEYVVVPSIVWPRVWNDKKIPYRDVVFKDRKKECQFCILRMLKVVNTKPLPRRCIILQARGSARCIRKV